MTHPLPTLTPEQLRQLAAWLPEVVTFVQCLSDGRVSFYWKEAYSKELCDVRPTEYRELVAMAEATLTEGLQKHNYEYLLACAIVADRKDWSDPDGLSGLSYATATPSQRIIALAKVKGGQ